MAFLFSNECVKKFGNVHMQENNQLKRASNFKESKNSLPAQ